MKTKSVKAWAVVCDSAQIPIAGCSFRHNDLLINPYGIFKTKKEAANTFKIATRPNAYQFSVPPRITSCTITYALPKKKKRSA